MADLDVYRKAKVRKDGTRYYSYLVIYVDDVLCVDEGPRSIIKQIEEVYRVKPESVIKPDSYLGMNVRPWDVQDSVGNEVRTFA